MKKSIIYLILIVFGTMMVIPFIWMITTAVKSQLEVNKGNVGFLPSEKYAVYSDGKNEYRVKIVTTEKDSSYVNLMNEKGKIISAFLKVPNSRIQEKKKIRLHFENFAIAFKKVPFGRYFLNTIFVSLSVVIGVIITSSLAAYAFARMKFNPG